MGNDEIKKANRKALPKFLLVMVISMLAGGLLGFFSAVYGLNTLAGSIKSAGTFFGTDIAPRLMVLLAVLVLAVCVPVYLSAKKMLSSWDGENEETSDVIDKKLSIIVWLTSSALILSFFLIAASYSGGFETFESRNSIALFYAGIAAFFAIMVESVIIQQKCIDTTKKMNPEKTASIYDTKFQKKWMDSCDEAEKIMVGKSAFKAYSATNTVCTVLAITFALSALIFETGFLPSLAVCIIWFVNLTVYCKEAAKFSKSGNKVS